MKDMAAAGLVLENNSILRRCGVIRRLENSSTWQAEQRNADGNVPQGIAWQVVRNFASCR